MSNKNIAIAALSVITAVVVCSDIMMYRSYTKTEKCLEEYRQRLKAYRQYYGATEALLDDIDKDVSLEDTYLCGDVGSNYHEALLKLDSICSLK